MGILDYSFSNPSTTSGLRLNGSGLGFNNQTLPTDYQSLGNYGISPDPMSSTGLANPSSLGSLNMGSNPLGSLSGYSGNTSQPSFWDSLVGTKDQPGWGGLALGAVGGLANLYMGMQQYGLYKQQLNENKRQFQLNYDAQKQMTNNQLEDRQRARVASNPGAYQSVGDYMNKYGIK